MAFTYSAGTTTPTYAGLVEFNSVRLNDGTFKTQGVPPIIDSGPERPFVFALSNDHGAYAGPSFLAEWEFDLEGWLWVPTGPDDVPAAIDYLRGKFNRKAGLLQMTLNARGWSAKRQILVRVNGQVAITEPEKSEKKIPVRSFVIPCVAPDPRRYNADTLQSVAVTTGTSLTNNGNEDTPFAVTFNGPQTHPMRLTAPDGSYIEYNADITSGHSVTFNTRDPSSGVSTAIDDTSTSVYSNITKASASVITPGTSSWSRTNAGGAGTTVVAFRDAWS